MTKQQFLEKLEIELARNHVAEPADIIEEYEQHFAFKLADGYSEEEIAAKLGDPQALAAQYDASQVTAGNGKKTITVLGLGVADFFFGILWVLLFAWEIIMAAFAVTCGAVTVGLFTSIRASVFALIPIMPYPCALLLGLALAALVVLSVVGTLYFLGFLRQLIRSFGRFHKNTLASASGRAVLPPIPICPQFSAPAKRTFRRLSLLSVTVFAVCLLVGFIACAASAGAVEFWHVWGWFGQA